MTGVLPPPHRAQGWEFVPGHAAVVAAAPDVADAGVVRPVLGRRA